VVLRQYLRHVIVSDELSLMELREYSFGEGLHETCRMIDPTNHKILIVDDNPQYTQLLKTILTKGFGFTDVATAPDASTALTMTEAERGFTLFFVDYNLSLGTTGGDLLTTLSAQHKLDNASAFLITSEPTVENQREALKAGAVGVVAKPFDRERIRLHLLKAQRARETSKGAFSVDEQEES
jgi:DNA-binding NtrC family response regulator